MSGLDPFLRRLLRYRGVPAGDVARVEHCTVGRVMQGWEELRRRGHLPSVAEPDPDPAGQLTFDEVDHVMRQIPRPTEC